MVKSRAAEVLKLGPKCPMTAEDFFRVAKPLSVVLDGVPMAAVPKQFSTGSFGWYLNHKTTVTVDGIPIPIQMGFNLTVIGSKVQKPSPDEGSDEAE